MNHTSEVKNSFEEQLLIAKQFILEHDDFLVVSHIHPDGDAASSTAAVGWILQSLNKRFVMVNEGSIPKKLEFLWGYDKIINFSESPIQTKFRYVVSVDCADYSRIGQVHNCFADDVQLLNIDHHPTNDDFGTLQLIRPDAAATVEILYDLFQQFDLDWHTDFATCIYTGLLTDTGGFRYSSTTPKVMNIAADLLAHGVNGPQLANDLLEKSTHAHILLLKRALSTLSFTKDNRIAWVQVSANDLIETNASNEDFEGIVNYPRNIEGVEVGLLFKEMDDHSVKVGFRSAGLVDVAKIAKSFGGGGHVRAAGCTIKGPMTQIIDQVVEAVRSALDEQ
jgi:phosphoesterase RecJ-like protein